MNDTNDGDARAALARLADQIEAMTQAATARLEANPADPDAATIPLRAGHPTAAEIFRATLEALTDAPARAALTANTEEDLRRLSRLCELSDILKGAAQRLELAVRRMREYAPEQIDAEQERRDAEDQVLGGGTSGGWFDPDGESSLQWPAWARAAMTEAVRKAAEEALKPALRKLMVQWGTLPEDEQEAAQALERFFVDVLHWARDLARIDMNRTRSAQERERLEKRWRKRAQKLGGMIDGYLERNERPRHWDNWQAVLTHTLRYLPQSRPHSRSGRPSTNRYQDKLGEILQRHLKHEVTGGMLDTIVWAVFPESMPTPDKDGFIRPNNTPNTRRTVQRMRKEQEEKKK